MLTFAAPLRATRSPRSGGSGSRLARGPSSADRHTLGWLEASDRRVHGVCGDAEVRGAPNHAAALDEQHLRRFMSNAQRLRYRCGDLSMGLHRHDGIAGIRTAFIKMRQELVERL